MDFHIHSSSSRAEAERWLGIAEKLLAGRDLIGSKTFAIRARESEPRLEAADQILAVVDTLIAGEKRINSQYDWYAILQLARYTRDSELIATQYRRLAVLLNPSRNRLAFADHAMKLVSDAWSVLSDPSQKFLYDNELVLYSKLDLAMSRGQEHHEQHRHQYIPEPQQQQQQQHHQHQQHQQQQRQQQQQQRHQQQQRQLQHQQQQVAGRSPRNESNINNNNDDDENVAEKSEMQDNHDENSTFWTACPYCYRMYEYPGVYVDCSLRCQNCRRAFHGTKIPEPPLIAEGKGAYFSCWGFYPVAVSNSNLEKNKGAASCWTPFSPMFTLPLGEGNTNIAGQGNTNVGAPKDVSTKKSSAPRIYVDDEDVFVEISTSDESDDEWRRIPRKKKKAKSTRGRPSGKKMKKPQGQKAKNVKGNSGDSLQAGAVMQEVMGKPNVSNAETSRKAAVNNAKKQTGKVPKEWGKLDLNVEFSNEVEEPPPGMRQGNGASNGEEDGIEGIGFFEGLDEFLSSLPILNVPRG